jgi:hypothetical protein
MGLSNYLIFLNRRAPVERKLKITFELTKEFTRLSHWLSFERYSADAVPPSALHVAVFLPAKAAFGSADNRTSAV